MYILIVVLPSQTPEANLTETKQTMLVRELRNRCWPTRLSTGMSMNTVSIDCDVKGQSTL